MIVPLSLVVPFSCFFFFNDAATAEIYTLSLHDALPIFRERDLPPMVAARHRADLRHRLVALVDEQKRGDRSEEHTSELQSHVNLVCRLLLEKKKLTHSSTPRIKSFRRSIVQYTVC